MKRIGPTKIKPPPTVASEGGHESSDIFVPGVVAFLVFVVFSAFVMHAGIWGWFKTFQAKRGVGASEQLSLSAAHQGAVTGPRLQVKPQADLEMYRREQNALLSNYSWFDRTAGLVRIPINQALDRVLAEGLPHWGPTNRPVSPAELQRERDGGNR